MSITSNKKKLTESQVTEIPNNEKIWLKAWAMGMCLHENFGKR